MSLAVVKHCEVSGRITDGYDELFGERSAIEKRFPASAKEATRGPTGNRRANGQSSFKRG